MSRSLAAEARFSDGGLDFTGVYTCCIGARLASLDACSLSAAVGGIDRMIKVSLVSG